MSTPVTIFQQLRSMFPQKTLGYIKQATSYVYRCGALESFVDNGLSGSFVNVSTYISDPSVDEYLRREWQFLQESLPDADPPYLSQIFDEYAGTTGLEGVIADAVKRGAYPKRHVPKVLPERKPFNVQLYCSLIPDPVRSFSHKNYFMTDSIKQKAVAYLKKIFSNEISLDTIVAAVESTQSLYSAYITLREKNNKRNYEFPSSLKTTQQPEKFSKPDFELVFEKLFIENESLILSYLEEKDAEEKISFQAMKVAGKLGKCPICLGEMSPAKLLKLCKAEHVACDSCVRSYTEMRLTENAVFFNCLVCKLYIPDSTLIRSLDSINYSQILMNRSCREKLNDNHHQQCPECNYPNDKSDEEITCSFCTFAFCVQCKKKAHAPMECNEKVNKACKIIEEGMTKELLRYCPMCRTPIIKEAGSCNKIICSSCHTAMCYVCRKQVFDGRYQHFYGQGSSLCDTKGLCPLFSDINNLHVYKVITTGKQLKEKLQIENPDLEFVYDPLEVLPEVGDTDALPGQF